LLPTKTIPRCSNAAHHTHTKTKAKKQQERKEWLNSDVHSAPSVSKRTCVMVDNVGDKIPDGESSSQPVPVPPVYLFYELVPLNANGTVGEIGDKHLKCYHGNWKVLAITWKMQSSLNGTSV
jgi:hypothetical protein